MRALFLAAALTPTLALAEPVTISNFVRAESDHMLRANMAKLQSEVGELRHLREPATAENQTVIRTNQDTLYSSVVLDLSSPASITLPEADGRYMSMHVINQDHYMFVEAKPGTYELSAEDVGTQFAFVIIRTFADVNDPEDVDAAHRAQDGIRLSGGGPGPLVTPDWNLDDLAIARKALNDVATLGFETTRAFGRQDQVDPVDHLIGAAAGWGGLPRSAAFYILETVDANDGTTPHMVTVGEVPVGAFWSITVYNEDGYLEPNEAGINSYNNVTATKASDGSITIHFGDCNDGRNNCLPISNDWNYAIRMYEPGAEILDGSWEFPAIRTMSD